MFLERLELTDFRNYESLRLRFSEPLSLFSGENAQGKTNILEAVLLLAFARSPRTSRDGELVRRGAGEAVVRGEVRRQRREPVSVSLALRGDGTKTIKVDGQPRRVGEAIGEVNVVFFGPAELRLVGGGPGERREFLNTCLGQTSTAYLAALGRYRSILRQRNRLLKATGRVDEALLLAYDDQLAEPAAVLMAERQTSIRRLAEEAAAVQARLSADREALEVRYHPNVPWPGTADPAALAGAVAERLIARRDEELRRQVTLVGPHRDDLTILIDGQEARTYASQGQQRTAALALKIAELRLITAALGEPPLLLLDDVLSELDDRRRAAVMELVDEAEQVLLTCAHERTVTEGLRRRALVWRVTAGRVTEAADA